MMNREQRRTADRASRVSMHPRLKHTDPMALAKYKAGRLTRQEVCTVIGRVQQSFDALRRGEATHRQLTAISTACQLGISIELQGVVKGVAQHLADAEVVIKQAYKQAQRGEWTPPVLTGPQLETLRLLIRLHKFQLEQLSYGEYQEAWASMVGRTRSQGGVVLTAAPEGEAL